MKNIVLKKGLIALLPLLISSAFGFQVHAQCLTTSMPGNDCSYGDAIDNITINAVSVSNAGCSNASGYSYFTTPIWNFNLGSSYPISLAVGGATYNQGVRIWIDINNNGEFESTESVYNTTSVGMNHTGTLVLPMTGATATVRMRVMCNYNRTPTALEACLSNGGGYGEVEDYQVALSPAVVPGPDATPSALLSPTNNACGRSLDSVFVTVTNSGTTTATNVPLITTLSGITTGSYSNTIPQILAGASVNVLVTTFNSVAGGTLDVQTFTQDGMDVNTANDTLTETVVIRNSQALTVTGPDSLCEGDNAVLHVNTQSGETYTWYQGSTSGTMILTADSLVASALTADTAFAVASSNNCRMADTFSIVVQPTMPIAITGADSVCEGATFTLSLNDLPGETYTWYQDSVGGTQLFTGNPLVTTASSGATNYVAVSSNGCRPQGAFQIVVLPLPTASFTASASNDTVAFTGTAGNATSVSWDFGDGNSSTQSNVTHVYGMSGTYVVCFTATNGCGSESDCDTLTVSVLNSVPGYEQGRIQLFPNPADDVLTIRLANLKGLEGSWIITDMQGRVLREQTFSLTDQNDETRVSLGGLASGSYLFRLKSGDYSYRQVVVKR